MIPSPEEGRNGIRLRWILALGYAGLIFAVSSMPSHRIPVDMPLNADKILHAAAYGILALLVCRAARPARRAALALVTACCIAYGILDEIHQSFVPGRDASVWDAAADAVGVVIVALFRHRRGACRASRH